ncbi:hypothetical protein AB0D33_38195 [Streptomyces sp. NPDC048404]|jgi:hypothetical protein|uniref:hypothetical protein n=1 Tax=unclassified Streptomyces TaxID=2593676 RepID=UPI0034205EEF
MRARITTPVEGYSGDGPGGIVFVDGTAESSDPAVVGYCQGAGYRVEQLDDDRATAPARSASKGDWVAYAVTRGAEQDDAEQLTRDQLAEQYGG